MRRRDPADGHNSPPPKLVRVVVILGHAGQHERGRAVAKRGAGIEVVRPDRGDPGSLHILTDCRPDVLILDVRLPEVRGADIAHDLRAHFPQLKVVVLEGYDHMGYMQAFSQLGFAAFRGHGAVETAVIASASEAVDRRCLLSAGTRLAHSTASGEHLTRRESETLRLIAAGRKNSEIAAELGVSLKTAEFHVSNVLHKLGVRGRVEAILKARELSSTDAVSGVA